jgi:formylglycine-generating enzyme required for sulfatase activity/serine/threonine protein kinase
VVSHVQELNYVDDFEDNSLGVEATYAGRQEDSLSGMSLGDEATLGDIAGDQEAVIDDIGIIDLESRYKAESTLGRGGMGEVLLAVDTRLGRKVAIKRILGEAARSKTAIDRFLTEAKSIAAIGDHPNIVQIYDYGRAKDGPFLIMEYVDGSSLLDRCRDGALPLEEAVELTCQLCDGLSYAHDTGIVHRDIKPANVLLTKEGVPKLTDFGLAKADTSDHQMTVTGAVLGTPDFMPPEQRRDAAEVDARSDLWSLAATLYQMVTGRSPKIIRFRDVPAELEDVLGKALEELKDDRFQTTKEFRDALKASLATENSAAVEFGEGQCPSCGMKNKSSRKFCQNLECGASLEASCLSCDKPMPVWDEICGECGSRQTPLVEQRQGELAAKQAEAESLLKEHRFEEAEALAAGLKDESDPRLKQLVPWAIEFLPVIAEAYEAERTRAASLFQDAEKHEASHDYHSALDTLALIPKPLQKIFLPGCTGTVAVVFDRVSAIQSEVKKLELLVNNRVKQRQLDGLIPDVERLATLCPQRRDVGTLLVKLRDRATKLLKQRDDAVLLAGKYLDDKDYEASIAVLRKVDRSLVTNDVQKILLRSEADQSRLNVLKSQILRSRTDKQYDGILIEAIEEAIGLSPVSDRLELTSFLSKVREHETKAVEGVAELVNRANESMTLCNYRQAKEVLLRIPEKRRSEEVLSMIELAENLGGSLAVFQDSIVKLRSFDYSSLDEQSLTSALSVGKAYIDTAESHGFIDNSAIEVCGKLTKAINARKLAKESAEKAEKKYKNNIRKASIAAGSIIAVAIIVISLQIFWSKQHALKLQHAITSRNWEKVLTLDPTNIEANLQFGSSKLGGDDPNINDAIKYKKRAEQYGGLSLQYRPMVKEFDSRLIAAWIVQGGRAFEAANLAVVQEAYREAGRLGADKLVAQPLLLEKLLLEADELITEENYRGAVSIARQSIAINEERALVALNSLRFTKLHAALVQALKSDIDQATSEEKWEQAFVLACSASKFYQDESQSAISAAQKAIEFSEEWPLEALSGFGNAGLRLKVVQSLELEVGIAIRKHDWDRALALTGFASKLDKTAEDWVESRVDVVTSRMTVDELLRLPEKILAMVPPIRNSIGMELQLIPTGTFTQRNSSNQSREVSLNKPFYFGVTEITNAQARQLMGFVPSNTVDDNFPLEGVTWNEANKFCENLSSCDSERKAGRVYRLPTKAEWEFACRGGAESTLAFLSNDPLSEKLAIDQSELSNTAWFRDNSKGHTQPVGQKKPNAWGLYDIHGNVSEWCSDWFGEDFKHAEVTNPEGPSTGTHRVVRGSNCHVSGDACALEWVTAKPVLPESRFSDVGFRVVMDVSENTTIDSLTDRRSSPSPSESNQSVAVRRPFDEDKLNNIPKAEGVKNVSLPLPSRIPSEFQNSIGMEFKLIPAGTFTEKIGTFSREVTLTTPFYLGTMEVTNSQGKRLMGFVPSKDKNGEHPVERLTYEEADKFCEILSARNSERKAGRVYRLPTKAEWQYACRAGSIEDYSFGNDRELIGKFAWYADNSDDRTHAVGQKSPNAWGLYDMYGNVAELCSDWNGMTPRKGWLVTDPQGPSSGTERVAMGRSYTDRDFRFGGHYGDKQNEKFINVGFRVALTPPVLNVIESQNPFSFSFNHIYAPDADQYLIAAENMRKAVFIDDDDPSQLTTYWVRKSLEGKNFEEPGELIYKFVFDGQIKKASLALGPIKWQNSLGTEDSGHGSLAIDASVDGSEWIRLKEYFPPEGTEVDQWYDEVLPASIVGQNRLLLRIQFSVMSTSSRENVKTQAVFGSSTSVAKNPIFKLDVSFLEKNLKDDS